MIENKIKVNQNIEGKEEFVKVYFLKILNNSILDKKRPSSIYFSAQNPNVKSNFENSKYFRHF